MDVTVRESRAMRRRRRRKRALERGRKKERHWRGEGVEGELTARKGDLDEDGDFVRKKGEMEGEVSIGARIEGDSLSRTAITVGGKQKRDGRRSSSAKRKCHLRAVWIQTATH